jgi:hypothetical protein
MDEKADKWKAYEPLLVIVVVAAVGGVALLPYMRWMHGFMGLFLLIFALFKLIDLPGFVKGFLLYDLAARRYPLYAQLYPFIELALACAWLSGAAAAPTAVATLLVMGMGAFSVIRALAKGLDVRCACLGNLLNVPLSTVTLLESVGMALMAAWELLA